MNRWDKVVNKGDQVDSESEGSSGEVKMLVDCLTKGSAPSKWLTVDTNMFVACRKEGNIEKDCSSKKVWKIRVERPQRVRMYLWEQDEDEMGPTVSYSLTAKLLLSPAEAATRNGARLKMIWEHPEFFKICCQINVDAFKRSQLITQTAHFTGNV